MAEGVEEVIKQKGLLRRGVEAAAILIERKDNQDTMTFPASSEEPVDRWYGTEVLSHEKGAVRLDRAKSGAMPLLFNHDVDDPIGMIMGARLENNRLMVDAKLFATDRAAEVKTMIDGGLRNVSLAYRVNVIEENTKSETYTITDWEPYEVSIVSVPADPTVGIGRAETEYDMRMVRYSHPAPSAQPKEKVMTDEEKAAQAAAEAAKRNGIGAVEAEKERRQAIVNLCKSNRIDARVEARWIEDGTPLTVVASDILNVMEERGRQNPVAASAVGMSAKEAKRYSIFRAIRALKFGAANPKFMEEASFEIECSRAVAKNLGRELTSNILVPGEVLTRPLGAEAAQRAMATQPGDKGGYMVNVENMGFIDILRNRSVAIAMGARNLSGLIGNVSFARQTGKASVTWQGGDGASVTASDQALGQLSMTPRTAIAITDVSEQLLRQSTPSAEQFVMADLAADIAIDGVDNAVINGAGGAQPLGIKNTTGITSGQDSATATYAKILAFGSTAGGVNAIRGNPGFVTNTAGAAVLMQRQRFTSTDTPLWVGNLLDGYCIGFRAMSSEQLASGNLLFGSWNEVVIGDWGVLELAMDNGGTRFNQAQVGIRAMWMVDVLVRYPQAFVLSTNLS